MESDPHPSCNPDGSNTAEVLLSLFVLLTQQCHSSQIDEVSKFDDFQIKASQDFPNSNELSV